jgi:hypothetical protein
MPRFTFAAKPVFSVALDHLDAADPPQRGDVLGTAAVVADDDPSRGAGASCAESSAPAGPPARRRGNWE